jgi:histidinol-phosphate/aromatic aminotransferase/cobyric acid decarboxylase-like protein
MFDLSKDELEIQNKLILLKSKSGTHSPSIQTIRDKLPELNFKVDACFLSNPYATELFLEYFQTDILKKNKLRDLLEYYPSQNSIIADAASKVLHVPAENIFIGNGAIEVIQACMHRFVIKKIVVIIPTFSSYYEFTRPGVDVAYYQLKEENEFELDVDNYIEFVKNSGADSIVLINPNNPTGNLISYSDIEKIILELSYLETILLDESFIHFSFEDENLSEISYSKLVEKNKNLVLIKSMSKDFGIAGIRVGYGIMSVSRVKLLLDNGYLWNSNGLAEYFLRVYSNSSFKKQYDLCRVKFIKETQDFYRDFSKIKSVKTYPTKANFVLVGLPDNCSSTDLSSLLLIRHGIYVRSCGDKIGLNGNYLRVASRGANENKQIISAFSDLNHD